MRPLRPASRRPSPLLGALLLGLLLGAGCKAKRSPPAPFGACGRSKSCPGGRICVLTPGIAAGRCVPPCAKDGDCPTGARCSGQFRPLPGGAPPPAGRTAATALQRYCQRATVPLGGDCSGLEEGCVAGLECRHGKVCVSACKGDGDCRPAERCEPVRDQRVFGAEAPELFRTCVAATARAGATCGPHRRPLCARDHACFRQRCVQRCTDDASCGEGQVCDGEGRGGAGAGQGEEAFRYCRRRVAEGERCGRTPERDLACAAEHRCYRGRCRRLCEADDDCAAPEGRARRCRRKRRGGERFRICL